MKIITKYIFPIIIFAIIITSCKTQTTKSTSNKVDIIGQGNFTSYDHELGGRAILYTENGSKRLSLENFNMTVGPDVHVYFSKTNTYQKDSLIEISKLTTEYTKSTIAFPMISPEYTRDYKFVIVYCIQYNVLFGYAELK